MDMEQTYPIQGSMDDLVKAKAEFTVVPRAEWSASPNDLPEEVFLPAKKIIMNLDKKFKPCVTREQCGERMREIEEHFLKEKSCSVMPYNFVVANDGLIYEGRGWRSKPLRSQELPEFQEDTIEIFLLATNSSTTTGHDAAELARFFLLDCVEKKIIVEDHATKCYCGDMLLF